MKKGKKKLVLCCIWCMCMDLVAYLVESGSFLFPLLFADTVVSVSHSDSVQI
jgi:hypothetical protein